MWACTPYALWMTTSANLRNSWQKMPQKLSNSTSNQTILLALEKIMEKGALERFFRAEGKMSDNVVALSLDSRKLRLYCLRLSDKILILGNGGIKTTRTYQEDETLLGYVCTLQTFNELLKEAQQKELIKIYGTVITNIDNTIFEL